MADEKEKTTSKKNMVTSTSKAASSGDNSSGISGSSGGGSTSRMGLQKQSATIDQNGETMVTDPMINIGCNQPGGIMINLPPRAKFKLNYGFNRYNKSIWEKIEASGQYDSLIEAGIIYLSKNG